MPSPSQKTFPKSKSDRPIINIDLDGVVYPWSGVFAQWVQKQEPTRQCPEPTMWNFHEEWGMSCGEWMNSFRRGVEYDCIWVEGRPIFGAVDNLWKLSDAEYHIRLLTNRLVHPFGHRRAIAATAAWLDEWNVPYRSFAAISDEDKSHYDAACLVDDNLENVMEFVGTTGHLGILFTTSSNRNGWPVDHSENLVRAESWQDVYDIIRERVPT